MRKFLFPFIAFFILSGIKVQAQNASCDPSVPFFNVDLTGQPNGWWTSPTHSRNGHCCTATGGDECTSFDVTLDTGAAMVEMGFDMIHDPSQAVPSGSMYYQINCGTPVAVGSPVCITGVGPHHITFCKPGNNTNTYYVKSIPKPLFPHNDTTRIGCSLPIHVLGLLENSITWTSIFPGAQGQYNSYLNSTSNTDTVLYTPATGAPAFIDYRICGTPIATACGYVATCGVVRIYNMAALSGTVSPDSATFCVGGPGVLLTSTITGGQSPYSYKWRNTSLTTVGTSSSYNATVGGSYSLEIKDILYDSLHCPALFISVPVTAVPPPTVNAGPDQTLCPSNPVAILTGSVTNATGGTWTGGAGTFTPNNTSLTAGYTPTAGEIASGAVTLTLTSTGAGGGCTDATDQITLHFPSPLVVTVPDVNVACSSSTATLNSTVTGGTTPYTYSWSTGAVTANITAGAGAYCLSVMDNLGCISTDCGTISQPAALAITTTSTPCSTNGGNDGTATASVSGGTAPYTYNWSNGGTTSMISGLVYGIYMVTVTDANGCQIISSVVVNEPRCNAYNVTATSTNILCNGNATGTATATVITGTPNYTYLWSDPANQTTSVATGLTAGSYQCLVTDANNCSRIVNVTITQPTQMINTMTHTNVTSIGGNDGSATTNVSGGTPSYTYTWSNAATTAGINSVVAGTYSVTVHDANNCTIVDSVQITQPPCNNLTVAVAATQVSCNGGNNGTASAIVLFANPPVTYLWSTGATTQSISGLSAGNYSLAITDAHNCTNFVNFTITQPSPLSSVLSPTNISCNGSVNGTIEQTISGGTYPYTYSWSNGLGVEDQVGLSAGSYSVVVIDAMGCTTTAATTIAEPAAIVATSSNTPVTCHGGNDGSIDATISGGITPFTYSWSNGATTQDINALTFGNYTLTVTDANGCHLASPFDVVINEPSDVTIDSIVKVCPAPGSGLSQVTVYPSGGANTTYQVSFDNGVNFLGTGVYTTLLAVGQTYQVVVHDANGCTTPAATALVIPPAVDIQATSFNQCISDGVTSIPVTLTVTGGNGGPLYASFDNGATYLGANVFTTNLATGNSYNIIVKDSSGCVSVTEPITIANEIVPTGITSSFAGGFQVSCNGSNDGTIDVSVVGGTGSYAYAWSNGATTQDVSNLTAGTYSVVITDALACTDTLNFTLAQPAALTSSTVAFSGYNGYNVSCNGSSNGSADLTVNGGVTNYTYNWSNGATTQDISSLTAGSYSVTITDANGCTTTSSVTLTQPSAMSASSTVTDILCFGNSTGAANLTPTGGVTPYTFNWSNGATTEDLSSLTSGSYSVTITDLNGCQFNSSVTLTEPTDLITSGIATDLTCFQNASGSINLSASGATPAYSFNWSNGATTEDVSGLAAGSYSVTVTDAHGCSDNLSFVVNEPTLLTSALTSVSNFNGYNISCNGNTNGTIDITVAGGTTGYTYNWNNGATTEDLSSLAAGTYSVTVTDANGCTTTLSTTLVEPDALNSTMTATNVLCFGNSTGAANLTPTGGVAPYTFNWSNGNTTEDLSAVLSGSYSVTITDLNGCQLSNSVSITQPTDLITSGITTDLTCFQNASGAIDLSASGATPGYTFNWSNGATTEDVNGIAAGSYSVTVTDANGCSDNLSFTLTEPALFTTTIASVSNYNGYNISCNGNSDGTANIVTAGGTSGYTYNWSNGATTEDLAGVVAGSYSLTATDANGCTSTVSVTLTEPNALALTSTQQDVLCNGFSTGSIDISVSGGVVPYVYAWSNSATTQDISNLTAGSYSVTTTDANGCVLTNSFVISQLAPVVLSGTSQNPMCFGDNNGSVDLSVSGGATPYAYSWSNGQTTEDISSLVAGIYTVTVTDANSCSSTDTFVITNTSLLTSSVTSPLQSDGFNVTMPGGSDGSIDLTVSGGVSPYTYQWTNGSTNEDQVNVPAGSYTVVITDGNGCTTTSSIVLNEPYALEMPTGYSPNADGSNDYFVIHGIEAYPNNTIEVFNRWGNKVYSAEDYMNTWVGMNNSGDQLPDGTYFVVLNINDGQIILKGYVDLRR
ncbi:MAG TPA: gliding motility-associated C-terminal domain-containing protein [Bacteroidia bacterium]|jgi:gliding motility-associated-like protein|nr:gliding motility-associated C-terminal domain-containing protein [Bacteroidia bacterium]